jgi:hypothetical protein
MQTKNPHITARVSNYLKSRFLRPETKRSNGAKLSLD